MALRSTWKNQKYPRNVFWVIFGHFEKIDFRRFWAPLRSKVLSRFCFVAVIGRLAELFGPSLAFDTQKSHQKGQKHPKKLICAILDQFEKNDFFRFLDPPVPWKNAVNTVILATLTNFTILKIASTGRQRHRLIRNIYFGQFGIG